MVRKSVHVPYYPGSPGSLPKCVGSTEVPGSGTIDLGGEDRYAKSGLLEGASYTRSLSSLCRVPSGPLGLSPPRGGSKGTRVGVVLVVRSDHRRPSLSVTVGLTPQRHPGPCRVSRSPNLPRPPHLLSFREGGRGQFG